MVYQQTIAYPFTISGIGLHSGESITVTVNPAPPDRGRYFVFTNTSASQEIAAQVSSVSSTVLSTELKANGVSIRTVEHLLAALTGMGIDNAEIRLDNHELPILDGSALPWVEAIAQSGITVQDLPRPIFELNQTVSVQKGDAFVVGVPAASLRLTYGIEFACTAIGTQWHSWQSHQAFATEIAPARTFTLASQIEALRAANLIRGGSLENAIVCDDKGWLNPPLRFANEPCRHKLLDLIGDFSLLGVLPQAHIVAYKASHALHIQFIHTLLENGYLDRRPD